MSTSREIHDHQTWLGYLQPDGLVVSPAALVDSGLNYDRNARPLQEDLIDHLRESQGWDEVDPPVLRDLPAFLTGFLQWPEEAIVAADSVPNELGIFLPEYQEVIRPTHAIRNLRAGEELETVAGGYLMLLTELPAGTNFDKPTASSDRGWETTPSKRFERLLRETGVGTGILANGTHLRLVHAPPGENPGSLTFPVAAMAEVTGRPILGGFHLLLEDYRVFTAPEKETLAAILKKSRDFQAHVSTALAQQVLDGLYELLRGLQAAHARTGQRLLRRELEESPQTIYEAMLNVLMRLVFLLFSEDRGLMPASSLYEQNYALRSLYEQLRSDRERYPDTMDQRYGSWARLLALFRLVFQGSRHRDMKIPARYGYLFDPDRFPFLEGRTGETVTAEKERGTKNSLPLIPDSTILFVLEKLLYLGGDRVSYRTLDVEQIGSVYETMMGFQLEIATGPTIALKPKKKHGAPSNVNLTEFLAIPAKDRAKVFTELTDRTFTGARLTALKEATTQEALLALFDHPSERSSLIAKNATPTVAHEGALLLQPSDARRKSGSHYTPRKLTEPIVRKALEPILANLTGDATGSNAGSDPVGSSATATVAGAKVPFPSQILELKVCDPAVGSGAFLVETCRQLGDELVKAWAAHGGRPQIPDDEDEVLLARRLVAQRCLYGVDRNPMAADLAKLSLWLATLAKDHPFTFLSHAIRSGDSLVGLSKKEILAFHWDTGHPSAQQMAFGQDAFERKLKSALAYRQEILQAGDYVLPEMKAEQLRLADEALEPIRRAGDLAILAFFSEDKKNARQAARERMLERWQLANDGSGSPESLREGMKLKDEIRAAKEAEKPVIPFHWEIEFPEVFERVNSGFDCFVGNPPYAGKNTIINGNHHSYQPWLLELNLGSHGNADLAAHFFRQAFKATRHSGTVGLVTTNTISQGDTRESGLKWICENGGSIYRAIRRLQWPGEAAVIVSVVHLRKGLKFSPKILDNKITPQITAYLFHRGGNQSPSKLRSNEDLGFIGSYVLGMGFTFDDTAEEGEASSIKDMERLCIEDPRNRERIFPYLGGSELNSNPTQTHHRFVINFEDFPKARRELELSWKSCDSKKRRELLSTGIVPNDYEGPVAEDWPELLKILEIKVKPKRENQGSIVNPKWWFRFARSAAGYFEALRRSEAKEVLAISRIQPNWCVSIVSGESVFAESVVLFVVDPNRGFACMQSQTHEAWARFFSSSMKDDMRYAPTDCFETFPFPPDWETDDSLETIGRTYYEFRAALMIRNGEGLTKTYNRFHDPDETIPEILRLRELHAEMDRAVLDAYGWTDVPTACEFIPDFTEEDDDGNEIPKNIRYRWPDEARDDVLARLLALNAERAAEEARADLQTKAKVAKKKSTTKRKTKKVAPSSQPSELPNIPQDTPDVIVPFPVLKKVPAPILIPTGTRTSDEDSYPYFLMLIPILLKKAGGNITWEDLQRAVIALLEPDQIESRLGDRKIEAAREWRRSGLKISHATAFGTALEDLVVSRKVIRVVRTDSGYEFRSTDRLPVFESPWVEFDADVALAAASSVSLENGELESNLFVHIPVERWTETA